MIDWTPFHMLCIIKFYYMCSDLMLAIFKLINSMIKTSIVSYDKMEISFIKMLQILEQLEDIQW